MWQQICLDKEYSDRYSWNLKFFKQFYAYSLFSEIESTSSSDSEAGATSESIRNSSEFGSQDTSFGQQGEQSDQVTKTFFQVLFLVC